MMKTNLKIALYVLVGFVLAGLGVLFSQQIYLQKKQDAETAKLTEIVAWIKTQNLKPGVYKDLLPPGFNKTKIGQDPILIANVSDNGAHAVLWKSHLEWHYNYHGYIYVDAKFPLQLGQDSDGHKTLSNDFGEENPYIEKTISNQIYFVCQGNW